TVAVARLARVLDDTTRAAAAAARLRAHELSEDGVRNLLDAAGTSADGALDRIGTGFRTGSLACSAGHCDAKRGPAPDAARGIAQIAPPLRCDVGAAGRASRPASDSEQVVAEERGEQIAERSEVEGRRREAPAAQAGVTEPVVELAPLGV